MGSPARRCSATPAVDQFSRAPANSVAGPEHAGVRTDRAGDFPAGRREVMGASSPDTGVQHIADDEPARRVDAHPDELGLRLGMPLNPRPSVRSETGAVESSALTKSQVRHVESCCLTRHRHRTSRADDRRQGILQCPHAAAAQRVGGGSSATHHVDQPSFGQASRVMRDRRPTSSASANRLKEGLATPETIWRLAQRVGSLSGLNSSGAATGSRDMTLVGSGHHLTTFVRLRRRSAGGTPRQA
jgi:hypothetical protein